MHTLSHSCFDCCCKDFKRMPPRRVALLPAPASTLASMLSPWSSRLPKGLGQYRREIQCNGDETIVKKEKSTQNVQG